MVLDEPRELSFSHPETEFWLPRYDFGHEDVEEIVPNRPSGVVVCLGCTRSALNSDHIPHPEWCPQHLVLSEYARGLRSAPDEDFSDDHADVDELLA